MNQHEAQLYRARKAAEYKFVRGWSHEQIAEELDVTTRTVTEYLNDPPEELADPIEHLKDELVLGTVSRLREQLAAAEQRAREAESPGKVFARDDDGNLIAEEIPLEDGGTMWTPVVEGMEMQPNHKARAAARQEERRIIEMLWSLAGVEEPDEVAVSGPGGGPLEVTVARDTRVDNGDE